MARKQKQTRDGKPAAQQQARTQRASDATHATLQVLYCELAGEASVVDCVTMHTVEIGMYELPPASPMSLVALEVPQRVKRVIAYWASEGTCVEAAFRVSDGKPSVVLADALNSVKLHLVGALA